MIWRRVYKVEGSVPIHSADEVAADFAPEPPVWAFRKQEAAPRAGTEAPKPAKPFAFNVREGNPRVATESKEAKRWRLGKKHE